MPSSRFSPEINRLRAVLRGHSGPELITTLASEIEPWPVAALVADNGQRYVASNAAARELTGYTQSEFNGLTVTDLTPSPTADDGQQLWEEFIGRGGQRGEYDIAPKRGGLIRVRYWAFAGLAPGLHISLLVPTEPELA